MTPTLKVLLLVLGAVAIAAAYVDPDSGWRILGAAAVTALLLWLVSRRSKRPPG
jgi:hypothetical protein